MVSRLKEVHGTRRVLGCLCGDYLMRCMHSHSHFFARLLLPLSTPNKHAR